jgi:hypothetical protein
MSGHARAFRITIWIGIVINFALALTALAAPDWLLRTLGFDVAYPNLWPRFAAWLLILLSLFYIPGANDLNRYRANAVLAVVARFAGVAFFAGAVLLVGFSTRYLLFGLIDLTIAVPGGFFLWMALRRQRQDQHREKLEMKPSRPRTIEATPAVAAEEVTRAR